MSFLGSVGSVMNGSGLSDVLETVYGSNAVAHMLHRKAIACALRGNFLVDAALTVKLMKLLMPSEASQSESDEWNTLDSADLESLQAAYNDAVERRCKSDEDQTPVAVLKLDSLIRDVKR